MCTFFIFYNNDHHLQENPNLLSPSQLMGKWESWRGKTRGPLCACWTLTLVVGLLNLLEHKLIFKYAYDFYRHTIPRQTLGSAMHIYQDFALLKGLLYATMPWADIGHQWKPCVCGLCGEPWTPECPEWDHIKPGGREGQRHKPGRGKPYAVLS